MLLAIDTSTAQIGLALYDGATVPGELTWQSRAHHTEHLAPALAGLLEKVDVTMEAIKALGVATGPGSFTALRVGLAFAKGLALGRHIPLVGIPTLDIVAASVPIADCKLAAVLQAGQLLGVVPPNHTLGCLQDIHWYDGAWGYFPTYTLGALAAAQLFEAAERAILRPGGRRRPFGGPEYQRRDTYMNSGVARNAGGLRSSKRNWNRTWAPEMSSSRNLPWRRGPSWVRCPLALFSCLWPPC